MVKYFFVIVLFLFSTSYISSQTDPFGVKASVDKLYAQGFTNEQSEKYGFNLPHSSQFVMEAFITKLKGRTLNDNYYYEWLDGNILYRILFLTKEYANSCVIAYIFDEGVTEEEWKKSGGIYWKIENDPKFYQYKNKTFYFVARNSFFKINENDEHATIFINIDVNGDGIIEDGEGRYMWF